MTVVTSLLVTNLLWIGSVSAQAPTPGAVQETLRPPAVPLPEEAPPPVVKTPPPPQPQAPADERRIKVERFVIQGNTIFSEAELRAVISSREGSDLSLSEIYAVADQLTDFYQNRGYSLTTVTVPAQRMQGGVLRLEVVEGRVGKLVFNGNRRYRDDFLAGQLDQVQPGAILRFADLEHEVLLLNDLPGLLARSVLLPGEAYGSSDIHLTIEETPATALFTLDNHGPKVIGQWRAGADFTINNPGRFGDVLGLGFTHTESGLLRQGRFSYGFPIHPSGIRLNFSYDRAEYDVGEEFAVLGIDGVSETARIQIGQPLIRTRRTNLALTIGGAHIKGQSDQSGIPLSDDEINFMETGFNFGHRHDRGGISTLSGLLATNFRTNPNGDRSDALPSRLEMQGSYEHPFPYGWSILVRGEGVLSADPLPDSNKYGIGGPGSVRGFISSRLRGDYGAMGSLEARRFMRFDQLDLQWRGFFDTGMVATHSAPAVDGGGTSDSLTGAGIGLAALFDRFVLDVQWARPLDGKESGEGHNARLWMSLSAGF